MARRKEPTKTSSKKRPRPALTPEGREEQLINLAYNLVEQRLLDGTATSQETTHFLKLGSVRGREELEKLRRENEVLAAKKEDYERSKRNEELYAEALAAMRTYSGFTEDE